MCLSVDWRRTKLVFVCNEAESSDAEEEAAMGAGDKEGEPGRRKGSSSTREIEL